MDEHPLRTYRRQKGVTLEALAEQVETNQSTLSRIETRQLEPSMALLRRLVSITGMSADDFLGREPDPEPAPLPRRRSRAA